MTPSAQAAGGRQRTRWTRETVIAKIIEWDARYGESPTSADWNPSLARWRGQEWRIERYRAGRWPALNAVKRLFGGSFAAAVRAAGLEPHKPGPRPRAAAAPARLAAPAGAETAATSGEIDERRAVGVERALAEADARVSAALDQADAARRDAETAHTEAAAARAEREAARAIASAARAEARAQHERARRAEERARMAQRLEATARNELDDEGSQAGAAAARATRAAELRALAAERAHAELAELLAGERRPLSARELALLRERGPSGPAVLAASLRRLTRARTEGELGELERALLELASAALGWRDRL